MNIDAWLIIAEALVRDLKPAGAGVEIFGHGLPADEFAALATREMAQVDHVLVAMAEADGGEDVRVLVRQLPESTLIALFSRFAHAIERLRALRALQGSAQPDAQGTDQVWRAVLRAMVSGEGLLAAPDTVQ